MQFYIKFTQFRYVLKRNEAILLVETDVTLKMNQQNGFISFRNRTVMHEPKNDDRTQLAQGVVSTSI